MDSGVDLVDLGVDLMDLVDLGRISSGKVLSGKVASPMDVTHSAYVRYMM